MSGEDTPVSLTPIQWCGPSTPAPPGCHCDAGERSFGHVLLMPLVLLLRRGVAGWLTLGLAGCASRGDVATDTDETRGLRYEATNDAAEIDRALVSLGLYGERLGVPVKLPQHGGSLHSGDVLWLETQVRRPCHLYIVQVDAGGRMDVLYPRPGQSALHPAGTLRLPADGRFRLDQHVGQEFVVVVAAERPIEEIAGVRALASVVRGSAGRGLAIESDYAARSQRLTLANGKRVRKTYIPDIDRDTRGAVTRGLVYEMESEQTIHGITDGDGVVVLPLSFTHLPRP